MICLSGQLFIFAQGRPSAKVESSKSLLFPSMMRATGKDAVWPMIFLSALNTINSMAQDFDHAAIQALLDREAIRDCLMRYCRGIDRCDEAALLSVYWPEAIDDHGLVKGNALAFAETVLPSLQQRHEVTAHFLGNILIELDGPIARVETYFQAYHRFKQAGSAPFDVILGGRYIDRMEKRGGAWKIAHRVVAFDWNRTLGESQPWSAFPFGTPPRESLAARKPDDLLYRPGSGPDGESK